MPLFATRAKGLKSLRLPSKQRLRTWTGLLFFVPAFAFAQGLKSTGYFDQRIHPLLKQYCFTCHSSEKHKGDFDMERFSSLAEVKRHPKVWQDVAEKLANKEMPPEEKPQPTPQEKERISQWVMAVLDAIGQEHAGDPGPVVLRRLSNAEYTYTVRDLTGVESLNPAREFPIDGAAGEGFMNTGQALVMSPSLLAKYLDAGKEIASHAVLLPDGMRFSPGSTRRDWTDEILAQIKQLYGKYADGEGRLPLEKYLAATIQLREKGGQPGATEFETAAASGQLNAKYLRAIWREFVEEDASALAEP